MMKSTRITLLVLLLGLVLPSCTHNNGDIGLWFGTWMVEQISDLQTGTSAEDYPQKHGPMFFQFQGDIATVRITDGMFSEYVDYGTWSEGDGTLDITFPDGNVAYTNVFGAYFDLTSLTTGTFPEARAVDLHFTITGQTSRRVTLAYDAPDGKRWQLVLRKQ